MARGPLRRTSRSPSRRRGGRVDAGDLRRRRHLVVETVLEKSRTDQAGRRLRSARVQRPPSTAVPEPAQLGREPLDQKQRGTVRWCMPVFEVVVIEKPTKKQQDEGGIERLVFGPRAVVSQDAQAAAIGAVTGGDFPKDVDMQRIDVLIRPFSA